MCDVTEPLPSGAEIPVHSATSNTRTIKSLGAVKDSQNGKELSIGLHETELRLLMDGRPALGHLYCYMIRGNQIFHTRKAVIIECEVTEDA